MNIQDIFTADELAMIDSGNYKPGRAGLDAKLDLAMAIERETCAKVCDNEAKEHERNTYDAYDGRYDWKAEGAKDCADAIRAKENING